MNVAIGENHMHVIVPPAVSGFFSLGVKFMIPTFTLMSEKAKKNEWHAFRRADYFPNANPEDRRELKDILGV